MIELGNEHSGYTIEGGTTFLMNRGENYQWIEALYHDLCTTVCKAIHRGKYYTETVK